MQETDTLFLFCEGPHDVAFCYLVMKYCFGLRTVREKFSNYPVPLNQLLPKNLQKHAADDLSLDMAHKFFLPDRTMTNGDQHVLLFNMGGKSKVGNPQEFLSNFLPLYEVKDMFSKGATRMVRNVRYLFLYDADHNPAEKIFEDCYSAFARVNGEEFIGAAFVPSAENPCAALAGDAGVYILGDPATGKGTLEDILLPIYKATTADWLDKADTFLTDCFDWDLGQENIQSLTAAKAKKSKALITTAGQGKKPGRPMTAIIQDDVLGSKANFLANETIQKFAEFLHGFTQIPKVMGA